MPCELIRSSSVGNFGINSQCRQLIWRSRLISFAPSTIMGKLIILIVFASVCLQLCHSRSHVASTEDTPVPRLQQSKQFQLGEFAFNGLRKALWNSEIYTLLNDYIKDLRQWSATNTGFKKSKLYSKFQDALQSSQQLLEQLNGASKTSGSSECEVQMILLQQIKDLNDFMHQEENNQIFASWLSKYLNFKAKADEAEEKAFNLYYAQLKEKVASFLQNLSHEEKEDFADMQQWLEKFKLDMTDARKTIMMIEFMSYFPEERVVLESKCKIIYDLHL